MNQPTIKAILFDNFGVLMSSVFEPFKAKLPVDVYRQIGDINQRADIGDISDDERNKIIAGLMSSLGLNGQGEIKRAYALLRRRQELFDYILKLRSNYKIGLLSNAADNINRLYSEAELAKYFDDVVLSYQVHLTKPDPKIFRLAARRLDVLTSECIMIDDRKANLVGAEKVGMTAILYQNFDQFKHDLGEILESHNA
jgi:putative hydrolase of the HAD superfamily